MNPFTRRSRDAVSSLGEGGLIRAIKEWLGTANPAPPYGIGDDCAVFENSVRPQVITVDPVVYGRHFDDSVPPRAVGAKLLKRNLSDIAAMGAVPTIAVISLIIDPSLKIEWLRPFYRGLASAARIYGVKVVGGDVAQSRGALVATLTQLGKATAKRMLTRTGARPADTIYVSGRLGGSLLRHHYQFQPRLAEGAWLARRPDVKAMMDLSDGLAKDIHSLTPEGCIADVAKSKVPISAAAKETALMSGRSPLHHALSDGEDYELLFSVSAKSDLAEFEQSWRSKFRTPLSRIGFFSDSENYSQGAIRWEEFHGYEHLR